MCKKTKIKHENNELSDIVVMEDNMVQTKKYDISFFRKIAEDKDGYCLSEDYINARTKLNFKCKNSHEFSARPDHIRHGQWCKECFNDSIRIYDVNHDFFSEDNENSFYIAGFLAADGNKTRASGSWHISLTLCKADFNHLIKIRNFLSKDAPFKYRETKYPNNPRRKTTYSYTFGINSKKMYTDLERFNIIPNKTYTYEMPEWLLTHPLLHHFMRGYADGDGCFCYAKNKSSSKPHVMFCMRATAKFLTQFHHILYSANITEEDKIYEPRDGKKYKAFNKLSVAGNGICSKLNDFLYKDATIYLDRKKEIAKDAKIFLDIPRPFCGKITKEMILEKFKELKSQKKVAESFNCTSANISYLSEKFEIKEEVKKLCGKYNKEQIIELYNEFQDCTIVAKHTNLTKTRIYQIIKEYKNMAVNNA
jgi:hypothetical protein